MTACSSKWTGKCEKNTGAFGAKNSISLAYDDNAPTNYGVVIQGSGGTYPNGIQKTYGGSIPAEVELYVHGVAFDDAIDVGLRMVFRDSSQAMIDDQLSTRTIAKGSFALRVFAEVPTNAASVDFQVGVTGAGKSAWIDVFEFDDTPLSTGASNAVECFVQAAAECATLSCDTLCGTSWCSACPENYQKYGCVGVWRGAYCDPQPYCSCSFPNSVSPVSI